MFYLLSFFTRSMDPLFIVIAKASFGKWIWSLTLFIERQMPRLFATDTHICFYLQTSELDPPTHRMLHPCLLHTLDHTYFLISYMSLSVCFSLADRSTLFSPSSLHSCLHCFLWRIFPGCSSPNHFKLQYNPKSKHFELLVYGGRGVTVNGFFIRSGTTPAHRMKSG